MTIPLTPCVHGRNFCISCHANQKDQALPLTDDERAELESLRVLMQQNEAIKNFAVSLPHERLDDSGIQIDGSPMILGRKLHEAMFQIEALTPPKPITIHPGDVYVVPADAKIHGGRKLRDALLMAGIADAGAGRTKPLSEVKARYSRKTRRSLHKLAGCLAFATACGLGAVLALLVLGMIVKVLP